MYARALVARVLRDRRGVAAIEFGLVASFFVMFVLGIMEVARYVMAQQDLYSAVHNAARYAVVHGSKSASPASTATLQTQVTNNLAIVSASDVNASASFSPNNTPGSTVTISATYTWTPLVPLLNLPTATITANAASTILN